MTVFFHASQSCFPPIALQCGLSNWDVKKRGCFSRMCSRVASTPQSAPGLENQGLVAMICHFGSCPGSLSAPSVQLFIISLGLFAQLSLLLLQTCFGSDLLAGCGLGQGSWQRLRPKESRLGS